MEQQQRSQASPQATLKKQPVSCPWVTAQPYLSALFNKNRSATQSNSPLANHPINNYWSNLYVSMDTSKFYEKSQMLPMQHSATQFFYFLRLMELFPDTHPATLHTVLTLCRNNFFGAVDRLLYAKRCKTMYNRPQNIYFQRFAQTQNRSHPYYNINNRTGVANLQQSNSNNAQKFSNNKAANCFQQQNINSGTNQQSSADNNVKEETLCVNANSSKEEESISSPSELQQQFKIPMKPISPSPPADENVEDLTASSSKMQIVLQE